MKLTINLDDDEVKILKKRADKNFFSLKEQVEDIIRRSCITYKKSQKYQIIKVDDRLVGIFSRYRRGRKKKKKK
jgi:hypothetical protein